MIQSDEEFYQEFVNGNQEAFDQLVLKYKDHLIYFIHRYIKNLTQAEDIAQDAFVEILLHPSRYHFRTSFKTYLFTIARNKAVDYIRRHNKEVLKEEPLEEEWTQTIEDEICSKEAHEQLLAAVKELKPEYQAAILCIDFEELSYKETAEILNKTIPQMKVLIHRARKSLKKILEKEGYQYEE